ncbi:hypothetical protein [Aureivirga marina]|uniref:hypothetical protein n=1 Tax=Aureivirga marina TaxID=1182451 RepID=UPI0018CA3824|nr:hypothetical protein [Aureivirga marina]
MIKKLLLGTFIFIVGFIIAALYLESFFLELIQDMFVFTTNNRIRFTGKYFYIFGRLYFYFSFGIAFLFFLFFGFQEKKNVIIKNKILQILIFSISLFLISAIEANLKVIQCENCIDGIRNLYKGSVSYDFIYKFYFVNIPTVN